jgi:L-2-hydroxyglutarate oxidase LhgO
MSHEADITIIGAGVVGLATAAQVTDEKREVYVLEKNETFGLETSSRNSGVVHAGIYYPEGSLKARMCVAGNRMLYELCSIHGIAHRRLGKLIVASTEEEIGELERLVGQGRRNGAEGLRILSTREMKELEPNVEGRAAILSASSGIVDPHALMRHFVARVQEKGGRIAYRSKVVGIEKATGGYRVAVEESSGRFSFFTRVLINCAGLQADRVAESAGIDIAEAGYEQHYCKGEYFSVSSTRSGLVSMLIYPLPPPRLTGVGTHLTVDLEGRMILGPSVQYVDSIDYTVDPQHRQLFYDSVRRFLPFIQCDDLQPEMAGIRPKLQKPGDDVKDFVVRDESDRGLPGFINLVGIESPGLTAAPAIAEYVAGLVEAQLE